MRSPLRTFARHTLRLSLAVLIVASVAAAGFISAPLPSELLEYRSIASIRVLDRDGHLLREVRSRDGRSTPLNTAQIPPAIWATFQAAEDKGFLDHHGVSPTSIARAMVLNVKAGRVVAGGSTITQQLARTLVPRERSLSGKVQEALWALRLEAHLSKEEIFTQYVNRISFGNNVTGIEAAAQLYFGKSASEVSLGQAAMLAAIPRGPTAYNPYRAPRRLEARRQWVFDRLEANGGSTAWNLKAARAVPLDLSAFSTAYQAPHFVEFVLSHLSQWGLEDATVVQTSLDGNLQHDVEEQIAQEVSRLSDRRVSSAAALVIDNATGEVLAYQGSADFFNDAIEGQNDGIQMHRQPGSALKPFIYAEAFRHGYTPATVIPDLETEFASGAGAYAPKNYDRRLHGPVRAREALANSYNVPAVRVASDIGLQTSLQVLHAAGFESLSQSAEHYGLGLALGNGEVTLWEAGRAYAGLARGGRVAPLKPLLRAWRADGAELTISPELKSRRFANSKAVALVTDILSDNSARARAFGLNNALRLPFPTAAKTGTSKGYSDNWTIGFTHERTVAVWAGNFDGTPMVQVSGITGAGPIFKRVMTHAMANVASAPLVDAAGLTSAHICPLSGALAGPHCPGAMEERFVAGTEPKHACGMHRDLASELPADLREKCAQLSAQGALVDLGSDYYDWSKNEGLSAEPWLAAACMRGADDAKGVHSALLHPRTGDEFMLLTDLPLEDQSIPVRVRSGAAAGDLRVLLDGVTVATLKTPYTGRVPAKSGRHRLSIQDATGLELDHADYVVRHEWVAASAH